MNANLAPYRIERLDTNVTDWCPVTNCRSLRYARQIALVGLRRNPGASYRATSRQSGKTIALARARTALPSTSPVSPARSAG